MTAAEDSRQTLERAGQASARTPKAAVIIVDGARYDKILAARTPSFDRLSASGLFAPSYITDTAITLPVSGPGHSSLLTGVWPDKHRVFDNDFTAHNLSQYPPVFSRLSWLAPEIVTFSSADWPPIDTYLLSAARVRHLQAGPNEATTDQQTVDAFLAALGDSVAPDFAVLYLHEADATGHALGSDSDAYLSAIERIDGHIGTVLGAVESRKESEDWLVVISTDHGQTGTSHGGDEPTTRTGWVATNGAGIDLPQARRRSWRQVDIVPTVLRHLDIAIDPAWDLDGIPIGTPSDDPFDEVLPLPGRPSGALPGGWGKAGGGDVRTAGDFSQWTLVKAEDWADVPLLEGRGSFVRGRDVIAVADPRRNARSSDAAPTFDSTLYSPWAECAPGSTVIVEFLTHYRRWDGPPAEFHASVRAEFDNGSVEQLWCAGPPEFVISQPVTFATRCVEGASRVRIAWRLVDSSARSYWAIDGPRITLDT